jgi:hypothetical protein
MGRRHICILFHNIFAYENYDLSKGLKTHSKIISGSILTLQQIAIQPRGEKTKFWPSFIYGTNLKVST